MHALKENKGTLTLAVAVVIGLFVYNSYFSDIGVPASDTSSAASIGADLIKVSDSLSKVMLSRELFSTSGYRLLSDFSKALQIEPLGRENPFAPLGQ